MVRVYGRGVNMAIYRYLIMFKVLDLEQFLGATAFCQLAILPTVSSIPLKYLIDPVAIL
jgi:hypothetical protein